MTPSSAQILSEQSSLPVLRLKRGEDRRIAAGHMWVFTNEVDTSSTPLTAFTTGALVQMQSHRGQFLGYAYVNPHALICARIVGRDIAHPLDRALIAQRLETAIALRKRLTRDPYYRLVFGESDGLPGLVLDRYGDYVVGQIATAGMEALRPLIEDPVRAVGTPTGLFWKNDSGVSALEQLQPVAVAAFGPPPTDLRVVESGLSFV